MYTFGQKSLEKLETCHIDLQKIAKKALEVSMIDFGISEGYRSVETQKDYFKKGLTKKDGVTNLSKHNQNPSFAFDFYPVVNSKMNYDIRYLSYLGGVITSVAKDLYNIGEITHLARWGGNWDNDGEIITDQNFQDLPHIELITPKKI